MRRLGLWIGGIVLALLLVAAFLLGSAHRQIRALDPPLPSIAEVTAAGLGDEGPVALYWIDTARQRMPRSAVLAPGFDPRPDEPYLMSHASFVLEWADGRLFLIDLGMRAEAARDFGPPLEWGAGADPIEPLGDVAEALGEATARVAGVAFTHEHVDHVDGLGALCDARRDGDTLVRLLQGPLQAEPGNYTTRAGRTRIEHAPCIRRERTGDSKLAPLPGFPGLFLVAAAGHTPGSQAFVARVGRGKDAQHWVFLGDIANHLDGVLENIPKPALYSALVVPESPERLERLRTWAASLQATPGVAILVSHDGRHLDADGPPRWRSPTVD